MAEFTINTFLHGLCARSCRHLCQDCPTGNICKRITTEALAQAAYEEGQKDPVRDSTRVKLPETSDEAAGMILVGMKWLEQHDPGRLVNSAQPESQDPAPI